MLYDGWAPWQIEVLVREIPNRDVSYRKIGNMVGRSRSAVCAKAQRLGLTRGRPSTQAPSQAIKKMPSLPPSSDVARILARHRAEAKVRTLVALTDLGESQCHFPIGDPKLSRNVYCGQPTVVGQQYCSSCVSRMYQPPEVQHRYRTQIAEPQIVRQLVKA